MFHQHENHAGREWYVLVQYVIQRGIDGLGRKTNADKVWVHLWEYFKDIWAAKMFYQGHTTCNHGFESAGSAEEEWCKEAGRLETNLREVAVAATSDKEHIQQMVTQNDDMLKVVRKQQAQIDKQQTQIGKLLNQNGLLISKIGTTTNNNSGGRTGWGCGNGNHGRNRGNGNRNTNGNKTGSGAGAGTNNGPNNRLKCAVCTICSYATADCWKLDKYKNKRSDNWVSLFEWDMPGSSINKEQWFCGMVNIIINMLRTNLNLLLLITGSRLLAKSKSQVHLTNNHHHTIHHSTRECWLN